MALFSLHSTLFYLILPFFLSFILLGLNGSIKSTDASFIPELSEDDWDMTLFDEWIILFCVSWHQACKHFSSTWHRFSLLQNDYNTKMAFVNFSNSPDLSARFMISELPTLIHSKQGVFRKLNKIPSDYFEMGRFLQKESWKNLDPIPSYVAPNTFQMTLVSDWISYIMHNTLIKNVHQILVKRYFLPFWSYYLLLMLFYEVTLIIYALFIFLFLCITRVHAQERLASGNENRRTIKRSFIISSECNWDPNDYEPIEKWRLLDRCGSVRHRKKLIQ